MCCYTTTFTDFFLPLFELWLELFAICNIMRHGPRVCVEKPQLSHLASLLPPEMRESPLYSLLYYMQWQSVQFNPKGKSSPQSPIGNQRDEDAPLFVSYYCIQRFRGTFFRPCRSFRKRNSVQSIAVSMLALHRLKASFFGVCSGLFQS